MSWQEAVGYGASALVVASLAMTSVVRLRMLSLAGSMAFVAYGVLIGSVPIIVTNGAIAVINVWFLRRELGGGQDLGAVVVPPSSPFLADFLAHHAADIARFQPEYELDRPVGFALVLMRDGLPAGVVLGDRGDDVLDITLDYVLPTYRDSRLGRWLYGPGAGVFRHAGVEVITTAAGRDQHRQYLERVGFTTDGDTGRFIRRL